MGKTLSVIVPLYNVEAYVQRAAESIAGQLVSEGNGSDWLEVVLVDDGSTDRSLEVFQDVLIENLPGVDVVAIRQENTGPGGARNTGIYASSGEYIMFMDGDDFLLPGAFGNILTALENNRPDVLFGRYLRWMSGTGLIEGQKHHFDPPKDPKLRTEYILSVFPEPSWNSAWRYICRRDLIFRHEIFFEPTMYCEDMKWVLELLYAVEVSESRLGFLPEPFYGYNYRRPGSIMNSTSPKRLVDLTAIIAEALEQYQDRPVICKELVWQVFYYINEYCTFGKEDRRRIYEGYREVLPMFGLAKSAGYWLAGRCRGRGLFYGLSVGMYGVKRLRRGWKEGIGNVDKIGSVEQKSSTKRRRYSKV